MTERLALLGGEPIRKRPFPHYPQFRDEEIEAVVDVLKSGQLCSHGGRKVPEFEEKFASYHGVKGAVAVNSGTAALHVALAAVGVGPGDEVIVPAYTFLSTATSVFMQNAIPVFADIDPKSLTIASKDIARKITRRTKAIIPVHINGHPAAMKEIMSIADSRGLVVIEDCAHAHGALHEGRLVGTIGHIGAFSFQQKKNLPTGEGGMVITNNSEYLEKARAVREYGAEPGRGFARLGWNYRMTEIEAAIGIVKLNKLDQTNAARIRNAEYLSARLGNVPGIKPPYVAEHVKCVYYNYAPSYVEEELHISRVRFIEAVQAEGIPLSVGVYDRPLYEWPIFREKNAQLKGCPFKCNFYQGNIDYRSGLCPETEKRTYKTGLELKVHPPCTEEDMEDIVRALKKVVRNVRHLKCKG